MNLRVRKFLTIVDETLTEMDRPVIPPVRRAAALAVIANPFAGAYVEDLTPLVDLSEALGAELAARAVAALGGTVEGYGKAALVGEDGELEHAAALLHPKLGAPLRAAVGGGAALVPSSKARGGLGALLTIPLGHRQAAYVRSHFDAMEARVSDAPRAGEIVLAVAVTSGGRPLPRVGGLTADAVQGKDGLR